MGNKSETRDKTRVRMKFTRRLLSIERTPMDGDLFQRVARALVLWAVAAVAFWTVFTVDFGLTGGARLTLGIILFMTGIYTGVAGAVAVITGASLTSPRV